MTCQHKHSLKLPTHISDTIILQMIITKRYCEAKLVLVPVSSSTQNIKKFVDAWAFREISPPLFFNYGHSRYTTEIQNILCHAKNNFASMTLSIGFAQNSVYSWMCLSQASRLNVDFVVIHSSCSDSFRELQWRKISPVPYHFMLLALHVSFHSGTEKLHYRILFWGSEKQTKALASPTVAFT